MKDTIVGYAALVSVIVILVLLAVFVAISWKLRLPREDPSIDQAPWVDREGRERRA